MLGKEFLWYHVKSSYQQQVSRGLVDPWSEADPRNLYNGSHVGSFEDSSGFVEGEPDASGYFEESP